VLAENAMQRMVQPLLQAKHWMHGELSCCKLHAYKPANNAHNRCHISVERLQSRQNNCLLICNSSEQCGSDCIH
jgi:hypothetical protein